MALPITKTKLVTLFAVVFASVGMAVALLLTLSPSPARADNGFCGVRAGMYFVGGIEAYLVRNKCGTGYNFAVYLPSPRQYASPRCQYVPPGNTVSYSDAWVDPNWYIVNC